MDDLERLLKKYRPSAPLRDLRERMIAAAASPVDARPEGRASVRRQFRSVRDWIAPLALAAAALLFYALSGNVRARVAAQTTDGVEQARQSIINDLAASLGGDEVARIEAEQIVAVEDRRSSAPSAESWLLGQPVLQ